MIITAVLFFFFFFFLFYSEHSSELEEGTHQATRRIFCFTFLVVLVRRDANPLISALRRTQP
jgi:hypothetical protein